MRYCWNTVRVTVILNLLDVEKNANNTGRIIPMWPVGNFALGTNWVFLYSLLTFRIGTRYFIYYVIYLKANSGHQ
jgi:hypothetical protein